MSDSLHCPFCASTNLVAGYTFGRTPKDVALLEEINKQIESDNAEHPEWEPYKAYPDDALISVEQLHGEWKLLPFTSSEHPPSEGRLPNSSDLQCRNCGKTFDNPLR